MTSETRQYELAWAILAKDYLCRARFTGLLTICSSLHSLPPSLSQGWTETWDFYLIFGVSFLAIPKTPLSLQVLPSLAASQDQSLYYYGWGLNFTSLHPVSLAFCDPLAHMKSLPRGDSEQADCRPRKLTLEQTQLSVFQGPRDSGSSFLQKEIYKCFAF